MIVIFILSGVNSLGIPFRFFTSRCQVRKMSDLMSFRRYMYSMNYSILFETTLFSNFPMINSFGMTALLQLNLCK